MWRIAAILTLSLGVGLSVAYGICWLLGCPHLPRRVAALLLRRTYVPQSDIRFRATMGASGVGPRGSNIGKERDESSDCVTVYRDVYLFPSPDDSAQYMQDRLAGDYRILEHGSTDGQEGQAEERIVTQVTKDGYFFILVRHGRLVRSIISASLPHALLYERRKPLKWSDWEYASHDRTETRAP